jgi:hypothetical protein
MNHQLPRPERNLMVASMIAFAVKTRNAPQFLSIVTALKNLHFSLSTTN